MSLIRRAYRQANVLIAISQELYRLFKIIGYDNVVYLPNPVEIPDLNFPKEIRESGRVNIGFFGQLKDYKGVQVLPLIAKRLPDVNFHVAGWGPLRDWLIKESAKYSNLIFHGYLSRDHLLSYIESLDAVLVPSICNEACPGAVLEAFAQRKPVVCFDLGGQAELVRLAKGGLLAKPFSVDDLCDKVEILISDPIKQAEFGLNGRKWVEQNCSPERHSEALINIYESLSATHSESMSH
jgi:glycosyltransferase involved in cell wall biosynthesis